MAHKPPINIRELKKSGVLDEERFFRLLSERCNYVDAGTVKDFYMNMVKLVVSDLRTNGIVRLPHIGDIALVKQKPRSMLSGQGRVVIDDMYLIKFYVKDTLREYFSKLTLSFEKKAKLDPREKVLGQILP